MVIPPVSFTSVRALIIDHDHVLVARLAGATFCFFPGGRPQAGESFEACLLRELQEELGSFSWKIERYLGVIDHTWRVPSGAKRAIQHFFAVSCSEINSSETPKPCEVDGIEFEWVALAQLQQAPLKPPSLVPRVHDWVKRGFAGWSIVDVEN